ncbi:translocon-associated protein subunit alpha [Agrilus planipennis]|uniref:Translocon-associated protein subunit alpha n=1 Tax=Agrilus planipennis TaxID=224129 RepID=A0A1W4XUL7_AGRPL|nr:translocon-associated protein subunit alpha [Agrilus planipennis]
MKSILFLALLVLPSILFIIGDGQKVFAYAQEDPLEEEAEVEGENDIEDVATAGEEYEEEESQSTASPDADTALLFVRPLQTPGVQMEIPAGRPVEFLIGFRNKGKEDFIIHTVEASFRYPMDFNFYIQNFSALAYNKLVSPSQEATVAYSFIPSDAFAGRPFGLAINMAYQDASGNTFQEAVFNETVSIIELEEGLDGETFFLYVFMAACVILLMVIGQHTLLSVGRKRTNRKAPVETGTTNPNDVDYDWLPKQTLASFNKQQKSPKSTKSPRQRKAQRSTGSE